MISNSPEGCVVNIVLVFLFCLCETSLLMYAGTDAAPRRASPIGILYSDINCLLCVATTVSACAKIATKQKPRTLYKTTRYDTTPKQLTDATKLLL